MKNLKQIINEIVNNKLTEYGILTEAFKSNLMRELNKYTVPKLDGGKYSKWSRIVDGAPITQYLTGLGIKASEVTDDQITKKPSGAVSYSRNNPTSAVIVVDEQSKHVVGILYGAKNVKIWSEKYNYNAQNWNFSKRAYNNSDSTVMNTTYVGGNTKKDKTGISNIETVSSGEMNLFPFYAIMNATPATKPAGYNQDYVNRLNYDLEALTDNRARLAQKVKDMKASKRQDGTYPEDIIQIGNKLIMLSQRIKDDMMNAIDNPSGSFGGSNKTTRYDNSKTYYSPYIEMYRDAISRLSKLEKIYLKGEDHKKDYNYTYLMDALKNLEKRFK